MRNLLLVTGASGFLGWNVCRRAAGQTGVVGLYHRNKIDIPGVVTRPADLADENRTRALLAGINPRAVIHTAAVSKPDDCERHPRETAAVNVQAAVVLAEWCAATGTPFIFTSTDLVFDGRHAPYAETDPPAPVNEYGRQKLEAENKILQCCPAATICRMPLMFGYTESVHRGFTDQMVRALQEGTPLSLFIDEFRTPVDADSAAVGLLLALDFPGGGIFHLGGRRRVSRCDMGLMIARLLTIDHSRIRRVRQQDIPSIAPRAADVSLDSTKAYALGYRPADIEDALRRLIRQKTDGEGT